jgi:hypothetical protein
MSQNQVQYQAIISGGLPWDTYPGEENRMRALMIFILILTVALWFLVPLVKLPAVDHHKVVVDEQLQKYAVELKKVPPPPPPKQAAKPTQKTAETAAKEKPKEAPAEEVKAVPADVKTQQARAVAKKQLEDSGIGDLQDMLGAGIGDASVPKTTGLPDEVGKGTGGANATTDTPGTSRNLLTSRAGGGSGGLGAAGYTGNVSSGFGGGVAGGKGSRGGSGGGGFAPGGGQVASVKSTIQTEAASSTRVLGKDGKAHRTDENIRSIFDILQGRLYSAYQKALRDNPNLQGTVVLKMEIQPDGTVTRCDIGSSELADPDLEAKIKTIVKSANFGSQPVEVWSGTHSINFFPT